MDAHRWDRVQELLADALELDPSERPSFLDTACGDDEEVRAEVESLLQASEAAEV